MTNEQILLRPDEPEAFYQALLGSLRSYRRDHPSRYLNDDQVDANDAEFASDLADRYAKSIAVQARATAAEATVKGDEIRLDKPAQVGNGRFGVGVKWSTVIGAAQRHHEYMNTPEREAERIAQAQVLADFVLGRAAVPQAGVTLTAEQRNVIVDLLNLARETYKALADSEEREGADGREHVISSVCFDFVSDALDRLEQLPDDKPSQALHHLLAGHPAEKAGRVRPGSFPRV